MIISWTIKIVFIRTEILAVINTELPVAKAVDHIGTNHNFHLICNYS